MPGRNDPCPCGSGKKYKKCCGATNVLSFEGAQIKEMSVLQDELMAYAFSKHKRELEQKLTELVQQLPISSEDLEDEEDRETLFLHLYMWLIFNDRLDKGKTIAQSFVTSKLRSPLRSSVRSVVESWNQLKPSIHKVLHYENEDIALLKNVYTDEQTKVSLKTTLYTPEEFDMELPLEGDLLVGYLYAGTNYGHFFLHFLEIDGEYADDFLEDVDQLLGDDLYDSPEDAIADHYPQIAALILHPPTPTLTADSVEWGKPQYESVAQIMENGMKDSGFSPEIISLGVQFWMIYCHRAKPVVRKPEVYAAAIEYTLGMAFPVGVPPTQTELAEKYGVSTASLSARYWDINDLLQKDLASVIDMMDDEEEYDDPDDEDMDDFHRLDDRSASFPSMLATEKTMREVSKLIEGKDFATLDELNEYVHANLNKPLPANRTRSKEEQALDLIYEAYETSGNKRYTLARQALELDPHQPDAYVILAEQSKTAAESLQWLKKGVAAGEKQLGKEFFLENKGEFWGLVETRPYMRAKEEYAYALWHTGREEEAIREYKELLELNPSDNQGIRYSLIQIYLNAGRYDDARTLLDQFKEEESANFMYNRVFVEFMTSGSRVKVTAALKKAIKQNPYVVDYLLHKKNIPHERPDYIGYGDAREAIAYCQDYVALWRDQPKLIEYLRKER